MFDSILGIWGNEKTHIQSIGFALPNYSVYNPHKWDMYSK